jgi:hypothetical protein
VTGNQTAVMRMIAQVIVAGGLVLALSVCSTTKLIDIICPPAWSATLFAPALPKAAAERRSAGSAWAGRRKINAGTEGRSPPATGATLAELACSYGVGIAGLT